MASTNSSRDTSNGDATEYEMNFCVACYLPDALPLITGVLQEHAHDDGFRLALVPGEAGSFDVVQDGKTIYSKAKSGRLPTLADLGIKGRDDAASLKMAPGKDCC